MKINNTTKWLTGWIIVAALCIIAICSVVYHVDPYMHYHKPCTNTYFYELDWQRYQNDGICRQFEYDALITGTSMAENFHTSEASEILGINPVKICYSGGSYKEIGDSIKRALSYNPSLKTVIRSLDMDYFIQDPDQLRTDLGEYPDYLYDSDPINDIQYLLNRNAFCRSCRMIRDSHSGSSQPGITSFDEYSEWASSDKKYGAATVLSKISPSKTIDKNADIHLTDAEKELITENITKNVTEVADEHPDVDFDLFIPPYSIVWWKNKYDAGSFSKQLEAEQIVIGLMLDHPNIHIYSFNNAPELITDLDNYTDISHYGPWINSYILQSIKNRNGLITKENYGSYINSEAELLTGFDYDSLKK